jgi:electron transport complex protein RnfG
MSAQKISIPRLGVFLGLVAAVAAGLLSLVYSSTAEAISVNQQKKTNEALEQVLPEFDHIPADEIRTIESARGWPVKFYVARKGNETVGYAGEVITPEGFSGDVTVMVGLNADGSVRKVIVTKQTETPGLGTAITDRRISKTIVDVIRGGSELVGLPPNKYLDQYEEKKAGGTAWAVVKDGGDVDAKTGATITSRAVCGAVYAVSQTAVDHLEELSGGDGQ